MSKAIDWIKKTYEESWKSPRGVMAICMIFGLVFVGFSRLCFGRIGESIVLLVLVGLPLFALVVAQGFRDRLIEEIVSNSKSYLERRNVDAETISHLCWIIRQAGNERDD
jgi:TM2 domain-containing membrane protein YozV